MKSKPPCGSEVPIEYQPRRANKVVSREVADVPFVPYFKTRRGGEGRGGSRGSHQPGYGKSKEVFVFLSEIAPLQCSSTNGTVGKLQAGNRGQRK